MKTGLAISALCHAALLLWGLLSFAAKPLEAKPNDALPVDIISDKQFSEITKGVKDGAKDKTLAALAEKVDTAKPVDDSRGKVTDKKVLDAAKAEPPPPAEQQPPAPSETRLEKKEPPKIDPIAETLKKEEAKKKAEDKAKAKAAQQAQAKPQPQFDPTKIAALLDKREPMRQASAADRAEPGAVTRQGGRQGCAIVAERDRRAAQAPRRMLASAGGRGRWRPAQGRHAGAVQAGRDGRDAAATGRGDGVAVRAGDGGKRQARDPDLSAVHHAAA